MSARAAMDIALFASLCCIAGACYADTVPDPFSFAPKNVTTVNAEVFSDPITVSGITAPAPISVVDGWYRINNDPLATGQGTVNDGDQVVVRLFAPSFAGNSASATLNIGGVTATFTVTVVADTVPDPMSFPALVGAPPGVTFNTHNFAVGGINVPVPISITGGEYAHFGQPFTSEPGIVSPFDSSSIVMLRVTSPAAYGETATATLTIGGGSTQLSVTTLVPGTRSSVLFYASPEGESIGLGRTWMTNPGLGLPGTQLQTSRIPGGGVHVSVTEPGAWYDLDLDAPGERQLLPGRYEGAERYPFHGGAAGISYGSSGRGCSSSGRFDVLEVGYFPDGTVQRLAANFEHLCFGQVTPLVGQIRVNSTVPLLSNAVRRVRADFDGSTWSDVLWRNSSTGENYLWPLHGTEILPGEGYLRSVENLDWQVAASADFDGDGRSDILWRNATTGETYVYLMDGLSIAAEDYLRAVPAPWEVAGTGDFDGDGKDDILWRNSATGETYVYLMNGLSIAGEGHLRAVSAPWAVAGIGDFDGDGKADVLWRNTASGENYLFFLSGLSIANEGYVRTVPGPHWEIRGVGDLDGDGRADIVWRNSSTGENYVFQMNGSNIASEASIQGHEVSTPQGAGFPGNKSGTLASARFNS